VSKEGSLQASAGAVVRRRGVGVSISSPGKFIQNGLRDLLRYVTWIEELGFDTITIGEHIVTSEEIAVRGNERWYREQVLWPDPMVTLGAVAAVTERVRLCTSIYIVPLRPAAAVAKMVATVDALSNGRLTLGVGAGWLQREFDTLGVPMKGRFARMEDTIRACKVLWTQAPASFHSPTVNFDDVWCLPQPVQPGGPPILFAGDPGGTISARIAELGDGWIVRTGAVKDATEEAEKISADIGQIRQAVAGAGRDPSSLLFQIGTLAQRDGSGRPDLDAAFERVNRYWDLGIEMVQVSLTQFVDRPEDVKPFLTAVAGALVASRP
jgi:probable F420-dependent oxidoreductase